MGFGNFKFMYSGQIKCLIPFFAMYPLPAFVYSEYDKIKVFVQNI